MGNVEFGVAVFLVEIPLFEIRGEERQGSCLIGNYIETMSLV